MNIEHKDIGKVINFIHQKKQDDIDTRLKKSVDKLTDLIKFRILEGQAVTSIASSLLDDILDIRMEVLRWMKGQEATVFEEIQAVYAEEIARNIQMDRFPELHAILADSFEISHRITTPLSAIFKAEQIGGSIDILKSLNLNNIKVVLSLMPQPWSDLWKSFTEESLKIELGYFMADLLIYSAVKSPKKTFVKDLSKFIKTTTERYAAYAMATGIWKPDDIYENQLLRNSAILASTIELESGLAKKIAFSNLEKMLAT